MSFFSTAAIGLDISDHSVEAVLLLRRGGRLSVASVGRIVLPPGLVVAGIVEKREDLATAIRKLLTDKMTPPLPRGTSKAVMALPESQVFSHIFEVPRVADEQELAQSLAIETDAFFPYNHTELISSQAVIAQKPDKKSIYYAAVHKDALASFLELAAAAKIEPVAIEPESAAVARACIQPNEREPVMLVDVGARVTSISVFDRDGIHFSESTGTAGDAFDAAIAKSIGVEPVKAEELRKAEGLGAGLDPNALIALRVEISKIADDVRAAISYYEHRSGLKISRIVLCGGAAMTPGFQGVLQEILSTPEKKVPVVMADPWLGIDVPPNLEKLGIKHRGLLLTTAVGLALRGVKVRKFADLDFLPGHRIAVRHQSRFPIFHPAQPAAQAGKAVAAVKQAPHSLKMAGIAVGVLGLAVLAWLAAFRLVPFLRGGSIAENPPDNGASSMSRRTVNLPAVLAAEPVEGKAWLLMVPVEVEVPAERSVSRESGGGGEEVQGLAHGRVRLVNDGGSPQTLIVKTRLLSEGGILFRLTQRVVVPARGSVDADVEADQPGASGDIGPSRFTIPGLNADQQKLVYGISDAPMTGGVTRTGGGETTFNASELDDVKSSLARDHETILFEAAQTKGTGLVILKDLFKVTEVETVEAPAEGSSPGNYTYKAKVKGLLMGFKKTDVEALLLEDADGEMLVDTEYLDVIADFAANSATLTIRGTFDPAPETPSESPPEDIFKENPEDAPVDTRG